MLNPQVNCSWCGTATRLEAQVCLGCRAVFTGDRQMGETLEVAPETQKYESTWRPPDEDQERAMALAAAMHARAHLRWLREHAAGKSVRVTSHVANDMTFSLMDELRMRDNRGTVRPGRLWFEPDEEGE
jgi:hypothetical protein